MDFRLLSLLYVQLFSPVSCLSLLLYDVFHQTVVFNSDVQFIFYHSGFWDLYLAYK